MKIKFITKAPETTNMAKEFVNKSLKERHLSKSVVFEKAQGKKAEYHLLEYNTDYKGISVKLALCYSCSLENIKRKTNKKLEKRCFIYEVDLKMEIEQFCKNKKLKYHSPSFNIKTQEKRTSRRPSTNDESPKQHSYTINVEIKLEEAKFNI